MAAKKRFSFQDKILFDDFFHRYYQLLCYFAFTYLNNKENAEDIVQSVFTSLWTTNTTFTDEEHAKLFLYKSIKNACINELKRESLKQNVLNNILQQETEIDDEETAMAIIRTEIYEKILRAINDLPPKCGKIFRLAYIESLKNEEIAKILFEIGDYLDLKNVPFKPKAYQEAAVSLDSLEKDVEDIYKKEGLEGLEDIQGVGESIALKIEEYLKTGKIKYYEELKKEKSL